MIKIVLPPLTCHTQKTHHTDVLFSDGLPSHFDKERLADSHLSYTQILLLLSSSESLHYQHVQCVCDAISDLQIIETKQ